MQIRGQLARTVDAAVALYQVSGTISAARIRGSCKLQVRGPAQMLRGQGRRHDGGAV